MIQNSTKKLLIQCLKLLKNILIEIHNYGLTAANEKIAIQLNSLLKICLIQTDTDLNEVEVKTKQ